MKEVARREYLAALGLEAWRLRMPPPDPALAEPAEPDWQVDWPELEVRVAGCVRCSLSRTRTQTVFGSGSRSAKWLIVGEAPGDEEDRQGEPFIGPAGQLLDAMLRAIGLSREQVFIVNVVKCRTPDKRAPLPAETAKCLPYLERQIELLQPKVMLAVGQVAAQALLRTSLEVDAMRQRVHRYGALGLPLVITYHPADLLRLPEDKRKAWEDLKFARQVSARVER